MSDKPHKLTMADLESIIEAAHYHAELINQLAQAYQQCDMTRMLIVIPKLVGIKKESIH